MVHCINCGGIHDGPNCTKLQAAVKDLNAVEVAPGLYAYKPFSDERMDDLNANNKARNPASYTHHPYDFWYVVRASDLEQYDASQEYADDDEGGSYNVYDQWSKNTVMLEMPADWNPNAR